MPDNSFPAPLISPIKPIPGGQVLIAALADGTPVMTLTQNSDGTNTAINFFGQSTSFSAGNVVLAQSVVSDGGQGIIAYDSDQDQFTGFFTFGVQVVGQQQAAIANATGAGDVVTQLNALLAACRTHGLIAT